MILSVSMPVASPLKFRPLVLTLLIEAMKPPGSTKRELDIQNHTTETHNGNAESVRYPVRIPHSQDSTTN